MYSKRAITAGLLLLCSCGSTADADQAKSGKRPAADAANGDPDRIAAVSPGRGGGALLLFETGSAPTRLEAGSVASRWQQALNDVGVRSYELRFDQPNRIRLCVWNPPDPAAIKPAVMGAPMNPSDLRVIAEVTFQNCASWGH